MLKLHLLDDSLHVIGGIVTTRQKVLKKFRFAISVVVRRTILVDDVKNHFNKKLL